MSTIDSTFAIYWSADRLQCFDHEDPKVRLIPLSIKVEILSNFLFCDLKQANAGMFDLALGQDNEFVF